MNRDRAPARAETGTAENQGQPQNGDDELRAKVKRPATRRESAGRPAIRGLRARVVLADGHEIVREGVQRLLAEKGIEVVGTCWDGGELVDLAQSVKPDMVITEVSLQGLNGIEATARIKKAEEQVSVVALSERCDQRTVRKMLEAGASAYVVKWSSSGELWQGLRAVSQREIFLSSQVARFVVDGYLMNGKGEREDGAAEALTARSREVLQLIAEGYSTKQMASRLGVSVKSVETYRNHLMKKLRRGSVAELTRYAIEQGITAV